MPRRGSAPTLAQEARNLVERLGGRWGSNGGLCRCPAHDDRRPSLSIRPGRTRLLLHCFAGCRAADVLRALLADGLVAGSAAGLSAEAAPATAWAGSPAPALRIWGGARPIAGTPAEAYLEGRGLETNSPELRYHPRTPHGPKPLTRFRPALIAAVRDEGGLVAVHRSFLDPKGNALADLPEPRCGLGRFGRGAVRLGGIAPRLGLAEGIETALSATALFGLPCWATLGTERFRLVRLPAEVTELLLFLDHDAGGRRAERLAREAFEHLPIEAHYPPRASDDWNDVLRASLPHPCR
ncbi:MAG TPA: toprim domain-containing protein [Allosphingosinicella sp.]|nr:toprim domain-containing protein [Allosphingosinicella sp.]